MEPSATTRRRSRRPPLSRGDAREIALLNVADELLSNGEFAEATLEQIATAAGISRPTFYFYFDSKQALLVAVIERTLDELSGRVVQAAAPSGDEDPVAAVRALMRGIAGLWWEHRGALLTAADLAGTAPSIFDRISLVIEAPSAEMGTLLHAIGHNRLTRTVRSSEHLARRIGWMAERNFYVLSREEPTKRQLYALADELADIALAAAGHEV